MNCLKPFARLLILAAIPLSACGPEVIKLTVDVTGPDTLEVGKQSTFTAVLKDNEDKVISGKKFIWQSNDPAKATVDPASGLVTGVKAGTVSISASTDGFTGKSSVTVFDIEVAVSGPGVVELGKSAQYTATVKDSEGKPITGKSVTWSSSDPAIATVDNNGVAITKNIGSFTVNATVEGRVGKSASIRVSGLEARGGTYNEAGVATLGTVIVRKLRDSAGAVVETESNGTLKGPPGWNNNQLANIKYEASRASSSEILDKIAVVNGDYTASVVVGATTLNAGFKIDASQKLEAPTITIGTLSTTSVPVTWGAVVGAKSYTVNLRQSNASSTVISSVSFENNVTSHTFSGSGLGLAVGITYKIEVRASTRNSSSGDPLPEQVNISARTINIVIP